MITILDLNVKKIVNQIVITLFLLFTSFVGFCGNSFYADSLELNIETASKERVKFDNLKLLVEYYKDANYQKALKFAIKGKELALRSKENSVLQRFNIDLAFIYCGLSEYRLAMNYAENAEKIAKRFNNKLELAEIYIVKGKVYSELDNYVATSSYFFKSLKLGEEIHDKKTISTALNSIGKLYHIQGQYDNAMKYFFESLNISKELNDKIGIARGYGNVATIYAKRNKLEQSKKYTFEALHLNKQNRKRLWEGINYYNIGTIYQAMKVYDSALIYQLKGKDIFYELNNVNMLYKSYLDLAEYYNETKNQIKEYEYIKRAFELGKKYHLIKAKMEASSKFQAFYLSKKDFEKAYKYLAIENKMKDSLHLEMSLKTIINLEFNSKREKAIQNEKLNNQKKDFIILILLTSIFLVIVIVLYVITKIKLKAKYVEIQLNKLEDQVDDKNKELALGVINSIKLNGILTDLTEKINEIQNKSSLSEMKDYLKKLKLDIQKQQNTKVWEEFELRFKEVHDGFYDRLLVQFPNLTPNDLKLCAFLRLNMTTKEISNLTGQRTDAIEIARHRLRSKLGINNSQTNLVIFISKI